MSTKNIFKCGTSYSIGKGSKVDWWDDIWCGQTPLRTAFYLVYEKVRSKTVRVRDCWGRRGWKWSKILKGFVPAGTAEREMVTQLRSATQAFHIGNDNDEIRWRWATSEVFSVKSVYTFLQDGGVSGSRFGQVWSTRIPLKVKIFLWLVLKKRVLTADNMAKRGWTGPGVCPMCEVESETVDHLFLGCPFSAQLLDSLLQNRPVAPFCTTPDKLWEVCGHMRGPGRKWELTTIAATWWTVWLERNYRIFELKKHSAGHVEAEASRLRRSWVLYCSS